MSLRNMGTNAYMEQPEEWLENTAQRQYVIVLTSSAGCIDRPDVLVDLPRVDDGSRDGQQLFVDLVGRPLHRCDPNLFTSIGAVNGL